MTPTWPELTLSKWNDTHSALQRYGQIMGKIHLGLSPKQNHFWQVAFAMTARGFTTGPMPVGDRSFELRLDLIDHAMIAETSDGFRKSLPLGTSTVAKFYAEVMQLLREARVEVHVWPVPVEMADRTPLDRDERPFSYDRAAANDCFQVFTRVDQLLKAFMGGFRGKQSAPLLWWGELDLALSRFSGRPLPKSDDPDPIHREAYSDELITFGFWPGDTGVSDAVFYAYAAPQPQGLEQAPMPVAGAKYHEGFKQFQLPYEAARSSASPRDTVLEFFETVWKAGSTLGKWQVAHPP